MTSDRQVDSCPSRLDNTIPALIDRDFAAPYMGREVSNVVVKLRG
jgi:hypothetical protein